jgi:signal transduction histidine kinase
MAIERILSWLLILVPAVILVMATVMIINRKR